jgi:hypothetical protein
LLSGRTYTLTDNSGDASRYYQIVREQVERLLQIVPGETELRDRIRAASGWKGLWRRFSRRERYFRKALEDLDRALSPFLCGVDDHLRSLSLADRFDPTLRTSRERYVLSMLEIDLTNRINRERFLSAPWRMALIAHCLRDFRVGCRSRRQDIEEQCTGCDPDCYINMGSEFLNRYRIKPCISVSMDHRRLFAQLKDDHPGLGVLGIACVPELVVGMRLCEAMGIPVVGVPLDANRCSRWLGECLETTFSLEELERLIKTVPGA